MCACFVVVVIFLYYEPFYWSCLNGWICWMYESAISWYQSFCFISFFPNFLFLFNFLFCFWFFFLSFISFFIKWKTKMPHFPRNNIKIVERGKIDTPNTQIHDRSLSLYKYFYWDKLEDTKGAIRIRISKNRQHNGQKKKDKQRSTKHTYKTKDRVTRTPKLCAFLLNGSI